MRWTVLAAMTAVAAGPASAQDLDLYGASQRAIAQHEAVAVLVYLSGEGLPYDSATIQTDIELRLRSAGIRVEPVGPSIPQLSVDLVTLENNAGTITYTVTAQLMWIVFPRLALGNVGQCSRIEASDECVMEPVVAPIWTSRPFIGYAGSSRTSNVREAVRDVADEFANMWLEAHQGR